MAKKSVGGSAKSYLLILFLKNKINNKYKSLIKYFSLAKRIFGHKLLINGDYPLQNYVWPRNIIIQKMKI